MCSIRRSRQLVTNERADVVWVDPDATVQYQIPVDTRMYPLVLVHGGGGDRSRLGIDARMAAKAIRPYSCAAATQSTLLTSHGVVVPASRRSTAPSAISTRTQVVPNVTGKTGVQFGWTRWRIGPTYPEIFPVQQFPTDRASIDQFFQSLVPTVSDDATVITDALAVLLDKVGPAILVTHSQSGLFGWLTSIRRPSLVKAVVSYEPGFVFPEGAVP